MKNLERYVFGSFLSSFFLAFLMLSFVLTIVPLKQIMDFILQGMPMEVVGRYALVSLPETMQWTVPLALLVASILVFSRLSADSEIAAMRACGVNLLTVMRWPLAFALLCTLVCLFVNNEIVPRGHEMRRQLKSRLSADAGLGMFEPGHVFTVPDCPKVLFHFRACDKTDGSLLDVEIDDSRNPDGILSIEAKRAFLKRNDGRDIELKDISVKPVDIGHGLSQLRNEAHGEAGDKLLDIETLRPVQLGKYNLPMDFIQKGGEYKRKDKDLRFFEILREIDARKQAVKDAPKTRSKVAEKPADAAETSVTHASSLFNFNKGHKKKKKDKKYSPRQAARRALSDIRTEFMKRWVFAFASICFVLVGVPLGIRAQRKESSVGMGIALVTALAYYLVVILMTSLSKNYHVHPEILIWLPVGLCVLLSAWLIPKNL